MGTVQEHDNAYKAAQVAAKEKYKGWGLDSLRDAQISLRNNVRGTMMTHQMVAELETVFDMINEIGRKQYETAKRTEAQNNIPQKKESNQNIQSNPRGD